jgi:hypothetical protein
MYTSRWRSRSTSSTSSSVLASKVKMPTRSPGW